MGAPKGNTYWKIRTKHGRGTIYTPETLLEKFNEYMDWINENPLYESKAFPYKGDVQIVNLPKMRAATLAGFCLYAGIKSVDTFRNYKKRKDFLEVCTQIEMAMEAQKIEGASAELLNPSIIARLLGLKDKSEIDHTTKGDKIEPSIVVKSADHKKDIDTLLKKFEDEDSE